MKKGVVAYLVVLVFVVSGVFFVGCSKKVSQVKGEVTAEAPKKEAPIQVPKETVTVKREEEKPAAPAKEQIREAIRKTEEEAPPQASARGKEFVAPAETALKMVNFEFDKASLTEEAKAILKGNAEWLKANPKAEVLIEGYCDERGTDEYNMGLGEKRAASVRAYLISLGIDAARLFTISYGEEKPLDPGHNEEAWAKNRRAQFKITSARTN